MPLSRRSMRGDHHPAMSPPVQDVTALDATALAQLVRAGELSAVEVVRAYRERISRLNPALNAIVTEFPDAEERARAAEAAARRHETLGPLHGVPVTIKDTFDTADVRTTRGSRLFADHVPRRDAVAVARLKAAGAIPLGKANTPEFALWWETDNLVFGRTVNPYDAARTAGGSSGGDAVAVAARLAAFGLGSDLGGSIRVPAAHCGVVGLKPTHGRIPLDGHWPETLAEYTHVGVLSRSVRDAALAFEVLAEPVQASAPPAEPRVGHVAASAFRAVDPEIERTVAAAAGALDAEAVDVPALRELDCNELTLRLYGAESREYFATTVGTRTGLLHPVLRRRLARTPATEGELRACREGRGRLRRELDEALAHVDVLLLAAVPAPAPRHGADPLVVDGQELDPRAIMDATTPFNLTGLPALVVPFELGGDGLPLAVQLVARRDEERTLFRVGAQLQARASVPSPSL